MTVWQWLRNVLPSSAFDDLFNVALANIKELGQLAVTHATFRVHGAHFDYLLPSQFGRSRLFASGMKIRPLSEHSPNTSDTALWIFARPIPVAFGHSAFSGCIAGVIARRAEEEMVWATADRVVAMVTDKHAGRNWPVGQFPSNSMSTRITTTKPHAAVPVRMAALAEPRPTTRTFCNTRPEPNVGRKGKMRGHSEPPFGVPCHGLFAAAPWLFGAPILPERRHHANH